jgi:Resolvase, N terminal domain
MVMAWSVDRLGRSLQDLVSFLTELHALHIDLFLHQQGLDTTTPAGKAMFQPGADSFCDHRPFKLGKYTHHLVPVGLHAVFRISPREKFCFCFSMRLAGRSIRGERLGRFGFICVPSASRGRAVERAADTLHRAGINAKTLGNPANTFTSALALV